MIQFFSEDIKFKHSDAEKTREWLKNVVQNEQQNIGEINYIFCSDEYLYAMNMEYLNHDTYTDILTFDNREDEKEDLVGDIFISIDRIKDNAKKLNISWQDELDRVMVHGILHLLGYDDQDAASKSTMRKKEDACLSLR